MKRTQLAIIGGGPGGYVAALRAARLGAQVTLIEKEWLGGVCLNVGCIPTKALLQSAEVFRWVRKAQAFGIETTPPAINWAKIQARKNQVVNQLVGGVEVLLRKAGVEVIFGTATFESADTIRVINKDGVEKWVADGVIIATGSRSFTPPIPGIDQIRVLDSTAALDLQKLPRRVLILGGGAIGLEWACLFSSFGAEVTVVEMLPRLLPLMDEDLGANLSFIFQHEGVRVMCDSRLESFKPKGDALLAHIGGPKGSVDVEADVLLCAVGRRPNVEDLGLDRIGVVYSRKGIEVDAMMRTSAPRVFAIGDVAAEGPMLAHVASHQGLVAAGAALGHAEEMRYNAVPGCVFTVPEAAGVGMTEQEAKSSGYDVRVGRFGLANNGKALSMGEHEGLVKVVADARTDQILGVHILGPHASDLILEGTLALRLDSVLEEIETTIHPHPTLGEAVHEAVLAAKGRALHLPMD